MIFQTDELMHKNRMPDYDTYQAHHSRITGIEPLRPTLGARAPPGRERRKPSRTDTHGIGRAGARRDDEWE